MYFNVMYVCMYVCVNILTCMPTQNDVDLYSNTCLLRILTHQHVCLKHQDVSSRGLAPVHGNLCQCCRRFGNRWWVGDIAGSFFCLNGGWTSWEMVKLSTAKVPTAVRTLQCDGDKDDVIIGSYDDMSTCVNILIHKDGKMCFFCCESIIWRSMI